MNLSEGVTTSCEICGEDSAHPPYCIECDVTGRSRAVEYLKDKAGAEVLREVGLLRSAPTGGTDR